MFFKKIILFSLLLLPLSAKAATIPLPNPLNAESIPELSGQIIRGLLGVSGAVALFMMVWGGIVWMTSQGKPELVKRGKDTLIWSILGIVAIFMSYVAINFIFTLIGGE